MAVNNEYVNRVDANGQTLIDLTNDTAEAEDVLEGQTFHLRSGAIATGTYKPSAEIEARLESTVGHSGKNQLSYGSQNLTTTVSGVTFTVDLTAGTVTANGTSTSSSGSQYGILLTGDKYTRVLNYPARSIPNGKYYFCGCPAGGSDDNASYNVYIFDLDRGTRGERAKRWDGTTGVATDYGAKNKNELLINDQSHSLVFNCRVYDTNGQNIIFRPMVWSGDIPDDTFEPYVTPTDEKKQDKPVLLWEGSINLTQVATLPVTDVREDYDKLILRFVADTTYIFEVSIDTNFNNSFPSHERTFPAVVNQTLLGMYVRYGSANMVTFNYLVLVGPDITTNTIRLHEIYGILK